MAGGDSLGCCGGLLQGFCGLAQVFLAPRGRPSAGILARRPGDLCSSSSQAGRTGSPRDAEIISDMEYSPQVARELLFSYYQEEDLPRVARNPPAVAGDLCTSSSQLWRTGSPRDVGVSSGMEESPPVDRELRFDDQEEDLSPVARNSPAAAGDLCSSSSMVGSTGSSRDVAGDPCSCSSMVGWTSWDMEIMMDMEYSLPVARNSPAVAPPQQKGMAGGAEDDDDDDDCVILDSDPFAAVAVNDEKDGCSDEELQIVAEKGKVACRDFPHSRHLCSNMPFGATSHEKHCAMCYCFVCDAPAPCSYWGNGLSVGDHCHATDKETKWKMLREAFRCKNLPAPHPETETAVHPAMVSLDRLFLSNQISLQDVVTQNQHTHTSVRASLSVAPTVNAPREGSGTSSAHTAQVTRLGEPTVSAPRAHPVAGAGRGTSNAHTAQVSAPRASSATGVGRSGTSNAHSAQVTRLVQPTVSAPRPQPAAGAGRGTSSTHTAQITHPVEPTVSAARAYSAARTGRGTSSAQSAQITHPVEPTVSAARAYSAARTGRGTSSAQSAQITRPVEQTVSAPRVYPAAGASSNARSAQITYPTTPGGYLPEPNVPEGATVYVGNLPYHIDNERLKLSFQRAGAVLFSKVIYDRETGQSRGFGFVTMNTVQEAEKAVTIYHGSGMYGRPLTVKIAAPRGDARVDAPRRQPGSPLRIFVCNLPSQVDNPRLEELFSKHGKVVDARVVYERREGASCSRGFGFVTMATGEESYKAIRALNKQILEGNALGVKVARERPNQGCLSLGNQIPPENTASQNQHAHTSVGASLNVVPTISAPRAYRATGARSSTSNVSTAQVTRRLDPTVSSPRSGEYRMLGPSS
ncbi:hypothetical protein CFC21_032222 [Triticum aestivum]|uniref:RRM domain-containing protein n=2 Tax=Triticum aestivum TaxID=4565 RepID=A0A9R1EZL1_WHEAT|nr:uncharacterized protein LOC123098784 [Triticum aestivum]KAF7018990.1 hypothetical protein CFC21_032222 [Triticum aestivum]